MRLERTYVNAFCADQEQRIRLGLARYRPHKLAPSASEDPVRYSPNHEICQCGRAKSRRATQCFSCHLRVKNERREARDARIAAEQGAA